MSSQWGIGGLRIEVFAVAEVGKQVTAHAPASPWAIYTVMPCSMPIVSMQRNLRSF